MLSFIKPNNPLLDKTAAEIIDEEINCKENTQIIKQMLEVAYGNQKGQDKPILVGLAAPQVGILKRIILVDIAADGKGQTGDLKIYINPEIIWSSKTKAEWYEGCFSTGRVCGIVSRPIKIKIKAINVTPRRCDIKVAEHEGYIARIFQHEIDHLNGKRFPDLIKDPEKLHWVKKSEFEAYRNKQAWRNWPKKCTFKKWLSIRLPQQKKLI